MGQGRVNGQQPQHRHISRTFKITLIVVVIVTILLGILIAWLLITQDLTKATSLLSLIASMVAILVGPITLLFTIPRSNGEHHSHIDPAAHSVATQTPPLTTRPLSLPASQPLSNAPSRTSQKSQSSSVTTQLKQDASIARQKQSEDRRFLAGPPISSETSVYIERKADQEAFTHLRNMNYISFIEPRLQGKTSLIYRLMKQLAPRGYAFVVCDLMNERFREDSEQEWYRSLGEWILANLDFLPQETRPVLPVNSTSWQTFLEAVAKAARDSKRRVVMILDELRDMPSAYATPFFTVIRSIYNERAITPALEHLTFITSGAFNPKELILDVGVSKFNVDQRIELEDFTLAQVTQLVDNLLLPANLTEMVAKRVHHWTDGQPYLTQRVCLLLAGVAELELLQSPQLTREVDRLTRQLFTDQQYLNRFRRLNEQEPKLFQYVQSIANGHKPRFNPALSDEHFRLANIYGVIKADAGDRCRIRNRICGQALRDFSMHIHY